VLLTAFDAWHEARGAGDTIVIAAPDHDTVDAVANRIHDQGITVAGQTIGVRDEIVTLHNDRRLITSTGGWVRNGDRWTVRALRADGTAALDSLDGRGGVTVPADYLDEHVALAYAVTVHKAQGLTVDRAVTIADERTTLEHLYVGMTQGRRTERAEPSAAPPAPTGAPPSPGSPSKPAARPLQPKHSSPSERNSTAPWPPSSACRQPLPRRSRRRRHPGSGDAGHPRLPRRGRSSRQTNLPALPARSARTTRLSPRRSGEPTAPERRRNGWQRPEQLRPAGANGSPTTPRPSPTSDSSQASSQPWSDTARDEGTLRSSITGCQPFAARAGPQPNALRALTSGRRRRHLEATAGSGFAQRPDPPLWRDGPHRPSGWERTDGSFGRAGSGAVVVAKRDYRDPWAW